MLSSKLLNVTLSKKKNRIPVQAKLDESLLSCDHTFEQAEENAGEEKKRAELELHEPHPLHKSCKERVKIRGT
jgi:hypothetical protein